MSDTPHSTPPACHGVSFFEDDEQLCAEIAAFIGDGLLRNEPGLIVTNEPHRIGITEELQAQEIDVERAVRDGNLLLVDAEETIAALTQHGTISGARYHEQVGAVVPQLLRGRAGPVRIFGDMVDLLWHRGDHAAAIRIEILSNELAALQPISVICGYSMGQFLKTAIGRETILNLHGRVHQANAHSPARHHLKRA